MIGVGIALIMAGIVLLFFLPWAAAPVAVVGIVLVALWFAGFGRRTSRVSDGSTK